MTAPTASSAAPQLATKVFGLAIVVLSGVQLMVVLDGTVANLALARIQSSLGLSDSSRTWVITSYVLAYGGLMLLGGRLGDAFGRRRMFVLGVGLFTLCSLLCGISADSGMLLAARALQGVGAAIASPTALALVASTYSAGPVRNKAIAIYAAMTGVGSVGGLILGGALTQVSWRWIFLINVPIGLAVLVLAFPALSESADGRRLALDVPGAILATLGCTSVVYGLLEGVELGWSDATVVSALALAVVLLGLFLVVERRAEHPLLPFDLFRSRDRVLTFTAIFFNGAMLFPVTMFVALFVQDILGYSPLRAGLAFAPFIVGVAGASQFASRFATYVAPRWLVLAGVLMVIGGLLYGSTLDASATYWGNLFVPVVIMGIGLGYIVVPLSLCAIAGVQSNEIGPLTAITVMTQELGAPIGAAVMTAVAASRTLALGGTTTGKVADMNHDQLTALSDGYTFALLGCAIAAALAGLAALFMRYTPAQVAQAQAAQESANAGA